MGFEIHLHRLRSSQANGNLFGYFRWCFKVEVVKAQCENSARKRRLLLLFAKRIVQFVRVEG